VEGAGEGEFDPIFQGNGCDGSPKTSACPTGSTVADAMHSELAPALPAVEDQTLAALEALVFVESTTSRVTTPPNLKVYYRRKRRSRSQPPPGTDTVSPQPPEDPPQNVMSLNTAPPRSVECPLHEVPPPVVDDQSPATLYRKNFIDSLTKRTDGLIAQPPPVQKRRAKARPLPTSAPCKSRRTARLGVEFAGSDEIGARKTVIRSLGITMEKEHVGQRILNDYAKLFSHLLSASYVQALAALFGWAIPKGSRNLNTMIQC
jgi:hypothetical protein